MRKKNVSKRFPMVLKALLLSLPLLFGATLSAQQQYPNLVDAGTALQRITEVLPELESNLANLSVGSPEYAVAERSLSMHMHTWEYLTVGNNLITSLNSSWEEFGVNAQGVKGDADELVGMEIPEGHIYEDPAFDALVKLLED